MKGREMRSASKSVRGNKYPNHDVFAFVLKRRCDDGL